MCVVGGQCTVRAEHGKADARAGVGNRLIFDVSIK